ncbi:hypothetical protein J6590_040111 [Homalodisca vitripennis]|nr:hypothetical protein J6590_040111 [Homalodisca vitripennis]
MTLEALHAVSLCFPLNATTRRAIFIPLDLPARHHHNTAAHVPQHASTLFTRFYIETLNKQRTRLSRAVPVAVTSRASGADVDRPGQQGLEVTNLSSSSYRPTANRKLMRLVANWW